MQSLNSTATEALREILANQPTSSAKVTFAWRMAAGPALARATETRWRDDGVLAVRARTDAWKKELRRAQPLLLARVRELLGTTVIKKIVIE
jgi:predicted nucleic acid-binding Zn ribbon protein